MSAETRGPVVKEIKTRADIVNAIRESPGMFGRDSDTPLAQIGSRFVTELASATNNNVEFTFTRPQVSVDMDQLAQQFESTVMRYFGRNVNTLSVINNNNVLRVTITLNVDEATLTIPTLEEPALNVQSEPRYTTTPSEQFANPVPPDSVAGTVMYTGVGINQTARGAVGVTPAVESYELALPDIEAEIVNADVAETIQRLSSTTNTGRAREIAMQEYAQAVIASDKTGAETQRVQGEVIQYLREGKRSVTNITVGLELLSDLGMFEANTILGAFNVRNIEELPNTDEWEGFQLVVVNAFIDYHTSRREMGDVKKYETIKAKLSSLENKTVIIPEMQNEAIAGEVSEVQWDSIIKSNSVDILKQQLEALGKGALLDGKPVGSVLNAVGYLETSITAKNQADIVESQMNALPVASEFNYRVLHLFIKQWNKKKQQFSLSKSTAKVHYELYPQDKPKKWFQRLLGT